MEQVYRGEQETKPRPVAAVKQEKGGGGGSEGVTNTFFQYSRLGWTVMAHRGRQRHLEKK